eukprot:IDg8041t1
MPRRLSLVAVSVGVGFSALMSLPVCGRAAWTPLEVSRNKKSGPSAGSVVKEPGSEISSTAFKRRASAPEAHPLLWKRRRTSAISRALWERFAS